MNLRYNMLSELIIIINIDITEGKYEKNQIKSIMSYVIMLKIYEREGDSIC